MRLKMGKIRGLMLLIRYWIKLQAHATRTKVRFIGFEIAANGRILLAFLGQKARFLAKMTVFLADFAGRKETPIPPAQPPAPFPLHLHDLQ
ncbi:MAG: hypothetical protein ABSC48_03275 [Terracidiphilus sp.]